MALLIVAIWAGSVWLDRSAVERIALTPAGPYRISSEAGPIEVTAGAEPLVEARSTWLLRGPEVTADLAKPVSVTIRCDTSMPCRTSATVEAPAGTELHVGSGRDGILVSRFSGRLDASAVDGGEVVIGPLVGSIRVGTDTGAIIAHGLRVFEADLATDEGTVDVRFAEPPDRVDVTAGTGPVRIRLPDGPYAVSVEGATSTVVNVRQDPAAPRRVGVVAAGPVVIERAE